MRILTWNILHGSPIPPSDEAPTPDQARLSIEAAAQELTGLDFDLIGMQEVDSGQLRSGTLNQIELFAQSLGMKHWAFAPTLIGTPGESWRTLKESDEAIVHSSTHQIPSSKLAERPDHLPQYGVGLICKEPVLGWHRRDLGRSKIGLPLIIPAGDGSKRSIRWIYVRDEPRTALAAELANGFTVVVTHLSFVPFVNLFQLIRIKRWLRSLPGVKIILGDLNLGWGLPVRGTHWRSLITKNTYPSWGAKIQFDYITTDTRSFGERNIRGIEIPTLGISDHLPLGVEFD